MLKNFLWLIFLLLSSCSTLPPTKEPDIKNRFNKDCVPQAIEMAQSLRKYDIEAKVLNMKWQDMKLGHAVCVYMYPPGKNQLWAWDENWASIRLKAYYNDPKGIADKWTEYFFPERKVERAYFLE
jgi:hypothetical protein